MRPRTILRVIISAICAPFIVIAYLNIETYAQSKGWDVLLKSVMEGKMPAVLDLALEPYMAILAALVIGVTLGIWADYLVKLLDSKPSPAEELGLKLIRFSRRLKQALRDSIDDAPHLVAEANSLFYQLRKLGIKDSPVQKGQSRRDKLERSYFIFAHLGPLLRDGHIDLAKSSAKQIVEAYQAPEYLERLAQLDKPEEKRP